MALHNFMFEWPWMLFFLPLPWLLFKAKSVVNQLELKVPRINRFSMLTQDSRGLVHSRRLLQAVFIATWVFFILALARPMVVSKVTPSSVTGYDLLLALDLSRSMEESLPSVKNVVKDFVSKRQGDRVGLIVFAENAYMAIPLTQDIKSVTKMVDSLIVGMAGEATSIGDAIALATQNLKNRPQTSRVLVLLTDGDDTSSHIPPLKALQIAKQDNIKIYTIGIGNERFNADFLKKVASETGGIFSKASTVNELVEIYANINKMEKTDFMLNNLQISEAYYRWFLNISLLGFMVIIVLMLQRLRGVNFA